MVSATSAPSRRTPRARTTIGDANLSSDAPSSRRTRRARTTTDDAGAAPRRSFRVFFESSSSPSLSQRRASAGPSSFFGFFFSVLALGAAPKPPLALASSGRASLCAALGATKACATFAQARSATTAVREETIVAAGYAARGVQTEASDEAGSRLKDKLQCLKGKLHFSTRSNFRTARGGPCGRRAGTSCRRSRRWARARGPRGPTRRRWPPRRAPSSAGRSRWSSRT